MNHWSQYVSPYFFRLQLVYLPFVFAFGAVVGSFLNVVILRLPVGENIVSPPSRCPRCGHQLHWHENLPIIGWILLRGRCSACRLPISIQYPLIELLVALVFTAVYLLYYVFLPDAPVVGDLAPDWFYRAGLAKSWPYLLLHLALLSSLLAMTMIDLRYYVIPISLTLVVTIPAILIHTLAPIWPMNGLRLPLSPPPADGIGLADWVLPLAGPRTLGVAVGGMIGLAASAWMLQAGVLRHSFLDFDLYVGEDDEITDYPKPRRELEWEIDYLIPILLGAMAGLRIGAAFAGQSPPLWAAALGGSLAGYLVGAGLVWAIRLLGTVLFGKEAMGLGDAHLLGCVGAVFGWIDPILIFFLAPFLAILGMAIGTLLGRLLGGFQRVLPYGPWLALATVIVMFGDEYLVEPFLAALFNVPVNLS